MDDSDRLDIILLGATGFTGKFVAKKLAVLKKKPEYLNLKWGIAGRSKEKIRNLLSELEELDVNISQLPVIECDIINETSLLNTSRRAKVLMNATGPNNTLSEPVVKACISTKTHYVDISAELIHMVNIYDKYHKLAQESNVLVIPACGFASMPALVGLMHLEKHFQGALHSVESYVKVEIPKRAYIPGPKKCLLHYGTWECFVNELQNYRAYKELKKQVFPNIEPTSPEMKRSFIHRHEGKFCLPYPGPDNDIVEMTQDYFKENTGKKPYHFKSYAIMPLLFLFLPAFFIAYLFSNYKWFSRLLCKYPRIFSLGYFSHEGPTEEMMNNTKFTFTLTGKGWNNTDHTSSPNRSKTVIISGQDPAYKTTAVTFIFAALTILKEIDKMPKGGVLTTGSAFKNTKVVENMHKNGLSFELMD